MNKHFWHKVDVEILKINYTLKESSFQKEKKSCS